MPVSLLDRRVYALPDVDRLLTLPGGTARRWIDGYDRGGVHYPPVVRVERAHAATIFPGADQEECLGCRLPWPCPDAPTALPVTGAELGVAQPGPEDVIAAATRAQLPWPIMADQLGVDRRRVQDLLDLDPALGQ